MGVPQKSSILIGNHGKFLFHGKSLIDLFHGKCLMIEGNLEVKLPTIWTDEKQSREEAERRERVEERRVE